jgi:hypothetical protein
MSKYIIWWPGNLLQKIKLNIYMVTADNLDSNIADKYENFECAFCRIKHPRPVSNKCISSMWNQQMADVVDNNVFEVNVLPPGQIVPDQVPPALVAPPALAAQPWS